MNLAQTFFTAIQKPENWYINNGMATIHWNYVDADCYMECGAQFANSHSFYDEFDALCEIYERTINSDGLQIIGKIKVDTVEA